MKLSRQSILNISLFLFALSCLLPAINHKIGLINLISGLLLPFYPYAWPYLFFWSANVLYYIDIRQFRKGRKTYPLSILAFVLALAFFILEAASDFKIFFTGQELSIGPGYYVWAISFTILPIYQIICNLKNRNKHHNE